MKRYRSDLNRTNGNMCVYILIRVFGYFFVTIVSIQVSERELDIVMDHLFTLNEHTPKIKCVNRTEVDPSLLFGIDSKLFKLDSSSSAHQPHNHSHSHSGTDGGHHLEQSNGSQHDEVEIATISSSAAYSPITMATLESALATLQTDVVYRVKGFVPLIRPLNDATTVAESAEGRSETQTVILNWAFGRSEIVSLAPSTSSPTPEELRLTIMGERGEIRRKWAVRLADALGGKVAS